MSTAVSRLRSGDGVGRARRVRPGAVPPANPWHAVRAMMVGFFMILVDSTIVAVAKPSIIAALGIGFAAAPTRQPRRELAGADASAR